MATQLSNGKMIAEFQSQLTNVHTPGPNEVRELIARRAYELYETRGDNFGDEISDWLQAEDEIVTMLLSLPDEVAQLDGPGEPRPRRPFARSKKTIKPTRKKSINGTTSRAVKQE